MIKNFRETVRRLIAEWVGENVETYLPAVVVDITDYEQTQQIRAVQPLPNILFEDNQFIEMPYIYNVPVEMMGTRECLFSVPIKVGDTVSLKFSKRSISELKNQISGKAYTPEEKRMYDTADCVAYPTVLNKPANLNPSAIHTEIKFRDILVSYQEDGTIVETNGVITRTYQPTGDIEITNGTYTLTITPSGTYTYINGAATFTVNSSGLIEGSNSAGEFTLQASGNMLINGCLINTSGNVITAGGTDLDALRAAYNSHVHPETNNTTPPPAGGTGTPTPTA